MKINELAKRTGVSKETIHHYIREGILRKPRKKGKNVADYNENYVEQIRIIKGLRDNYFLPLPVVKKILKKHKKQSSSEQASFQFLSEYFKPIDRFFASDIVGEEAFREATGLKSKWLKKMEEWGIINAVETDGNLVYSQDDVIIGKLVVAMGKLGFGPRQGVDPAMLGRYTEYFRTVIMSQTKEYLQENLDKISSAEFTHNGSQLTELMSLFFYHLYRKLTVEMFNDFLNAHEKDTDD